MIEKLFEEVTKDWIESDWEGTSEDDLRHQISEFLDLMGNPEKSTANMSHLIYYFERYMEW